MTSVKKTFAAVLALGACLAAPAYAGDAESCKAVRFADVGWTDIQVTTGAASVVLEALGYTPEVKTLSVPVTIRLAEEQGHRRLPRQLDAQHDGGYPALSGRQVGGAAGDQS